MPIGNVAKSLDIIGKVADSLFEKRKLPLFFGGEHLISFPLILSAYNHYPDLIILHFDAHADLREEYIGETLSHSTVMRRVAECCIAPVYQFGIRSGIREEREYAKQRTRLTPYKVINPLKEVIPLIKDKPVYVTFDIDVVDPAFAPGTGTPEPGGITSSEALEAICLLGELNIIGMDIVEVSPALDVSMRTALLAAKMAREFIIAAI